MMLWILLIGVPILLGLFAQMRVSSAFSRWKQVAASSGVTGAQAAREILSAANIRDVEVVEINDMLGDHYDPSNKRLCLSTDVYRTPSVAALGIAAHECGHAIQHQKAYAPLQWRMAVVPLTMFVSQILPFVILPLLKDKNWTITAKLRMTLTLKKKDIMLNVGIYNIDRKTNTLVKNFPVENFVGKDYVSLTLPAVQLTDKDQLWFYVDGNCNCIDQLLVDYIELKPSN